jgi:hypothetical protein
VDAGFLCDKATVLGAAIKETPCNINTCRPVSVYGNNLHLVILNSV